jgi:hypothetical protein
MKRSKQLAYQVIGSESKERMLVPNISHPFSIASMMMPHCKKKP